jgi:HD-GYP domain-containing protein (c-di-GMP phosphodiesterase class II)
VKVLTEILSLVDSKSFGHAEKLGALVAELATKVPVADTWEVQLAAMLSPIGYVTLPAETLVRAHADEPLSNMEQQLVDAVPDIAGRLLSNIPRLEGVAKIVRYQRKHFDGGGFPYDDTKGDAIPSGARLLRILNDMLELQAEKKSRSEALNELSSRRGLYDPQLLSLVRMAFGIAGERRDDTSQTALISINDLAPGMVLHTDILTKDGIMILSAGHHISQMVLEKIQNFKMIYGIKEPVYIKTGG